MKLTQAQARALKAYAWPGNIRELKNVIERAVILSTGSQLRLEINAPDVGLPSAAMPAPLADSILTEADMRQLARENMVRALEASDWRVSGKDGAAQKLGIRPTTLADRIKAQKIVRPTRRER